MNTTVAVLMTCHNRKEGTLKCLGHLFAQVVPELAVAVYLVDDGSTDGTGDAIRKMYPEVTVITGDGTLFWCGGMRLAWQHALAMAPDCYLWLNDDTFLHPGSLQTLLRAKESELQQQCVVVGSCCDAGTGTHTYGGQALLGRHPARVSLIRPDPVLTKMCDTFNGNLILITKAAFQMLGIIRSFSHATGDTDYGLHARRQRIPVLLAPGFLAECAANPVAQSWSNCELPRMQRFRMLIGRKGLPPGDWWRFLWTNAGIRALVYWPIPYLRVLVGL